MRPSISRTLNQLVAGHEADSSERHDPLPDSLTHLCTFRSQFDPSLHIPLSLCFGASPTRCLFPQSYRGGVATQRDEPTEPVKHNVFRVVREKKVSTTRRRHLGVGSELKGDTGDACRVRAAPCTSVRYLRPIDLADVTVHRRRDSRCLSDPLREAHRKVSF